MSQLSDWARWVAFTAGVLIVAGTWLSVIGTLIVPRPISSRMSRWTGLATIALFARAYWVEIQAMEKNAQMMDEYLSD